MTERTYIEEATADLYSSMVEMTKALERMNLTKAEVKSVEISRRKARDAMRNLMVIETKHKKKRDELTAKLDALSQASQDDEGGYW